jgi:hypothetical protein
MASIKRNMESQKRKKDGDRNERVYGVGVGVSQNLCKTCRSKKKENLKGKQQN